MHDIITPLEDVRQQLVDNQINTSDALLIILNCLRPVVSLERIEFLNRELLGYSHKDVARLATKRERQAKASQVISGEFSPFITGEDPTIDRVLPGLKVQIQIESDGTITVADETRVSTIFCANGIIELEQLLSNNADLFSAVDYDEATQSVFMCKTRHLRNLNDALRKKIGRFLDDTIAEFKAMAQTMDMKVNMSAVESTSETLTES